MTNPLSRFKQWLATQNVFRAAWFNQDPQPEPDRKKSLSQIPDDVRDELQAAVHDLPNHPKEIERVTEALDHAITRWRKNPHSASNSIVILRYPISSVAQILADSLEQLKSRKNDPLFIKRLDWEERPPELSNLKQQIQKKLDLGDADDSPTDPETSTDNNDKKSLAVIPNLCWCFLRSTEGLDGLDYLQSILLDNRAQFWVMGCGHVGWEYLKCALKFNAYCGDTVVLPNLTGEQLRGWLEPVIKKFDIEFRDAALQDRLKDPGSMFNTNLSDAELSIDKPIQAISEITSEITQGVSATAQSSLREIKSEVFSEEGTASEAGPQSEYFERLADISDGVSIVALQLFIKSLRYQDIALQAVSQKVLNQTVDKSEQTDRDQSPSSRQLVAIVPKLPALPELSQSDLYLLYSLMLHGNLTIRALANTLGDSPQVVNNQVQVLRSTNIVEQKDNIVNISLTHYPRLRRELARNNFMIEVP